MHRLGLARAVLHGPQRSCCSTNPREASTRSLRLIFADFSKTNSCATRARRCCFHLTRLGEIEEIADRVILLEEGIDSRLGFTASTLRRHRDADAGEGDGETHAPSSPHRGASVSALRTLRKILAFFWRDFAIARGYRGALVLEILEAFFGVATFYYLSRFVESPELAAALPHGSNYFAFALVGFAFFDYLSVSIDAFESSLEEARQNRTLEALLVTQTPLSVILAGSAVYPFFALALRTCVYLAWGVLLFGFAPRSANWAGAAAILFASVLAFAGLGILSASYQILFKRGNPAKWVVLGVSGLVGGMMYPIIGSAASVATARAADSGDVFARRACELLFWAQQDGANCCHRFSRCFSSPRS